MFKIGLEKEYFLLDESGKPMLVPSYLPMDDCGWLAEARGEPFTDPVRAVFSIRAEEYRMGVLLANYNARTGQRCSFSDAPVMTVPKDVQHAARRRSGKGTIDYQNFYGHTDHKQAASQGTAGIHVSVTKPGQAYHKDSSSLEYNGNFDWPSIFIGLDRAFKSEITQAKRNPGFYELKPDGRVEYRSLPANVSWDKLITVLNGLLGSY
jgi:hypothetical protein